MFEININDCIYTRPVVDMKLFIYQSLPETELISTTWKIGRNAEVSKNAFEWQIAHPLL